MACLLLVLASASAFAAQYVYDANGRLIAATTDAGNTARYHYDALGNITRIQRLQAGTLALFDFSPGDGGSGDRVVIKGQGFSTTAAQNSVRFNGVIANVLAATASQLTVTVPATATTGRIAVTVGAQSATTDSDFVVNAQARAPVITSVTPRVASIGAAISITGQSLQPIAGQTTARLGLNPLPISAASNAQLTAQIPKGAASGRVRVTTPFGVATSAEDVLIVPAGLAEADVSQVLRLTVDGAVTSFATTAAGQRIAVLFESSGSDYISAQFSSLAGPVDYALYGVDNKRLVTGTASSSAPSFHMPELKVAGTHLLVLTPKNGPLTWEMQLERSPHLVVDGSVQEINTTRAGQSRRLVIDAQQGLPLGLGLAEKTGPPAWGSATVSVLAADGTQAGFQQCSQTNNGCSLNLSALSTGRHTVLIAPAASGTRLLDFDIALSSDATATLVRDAPLALSLSRTGRNARLTFNGAAGEVLGLLVAGQQTLPEGRGVYYRVHAPDGSLWKSVAASRGLVMNLALPSTGRYDVVVDAGYGETLQADVLLSTAASSPVIDGASSTVAVVRPGEGAYLQIDAVSGTPLGLGLSALAIADGSSVALNVYRPDGQLLANTTCHAVNLGCDLNLLPQDSGAHGVEIVPLDPEQTMSFNATVSTDVSMTLQRGQASSLALSRSGQNARLDFSAVANEVIAFKVTAQSTQPGTAGVYYRAYRPDGTSITSGYAAGTKTLLIDTTVAGAYQIFVDPEYAATLTASVTLEAGVLGEMEQDGSIGQYQNQAGKDVNFTVNAEAGKHLGFGISHLAVSSGTHVRIYAYTPSGASVGNDTYCYVSNGGCDVQLYNPVSGAYSIVVRPFNASQTMTFRTTLSSAYAATLSRDVPLNLSLDRRGQDALMTFSGLAGETVALQVAGQSTLPAGRTVTYSVFKPSDRRWGYRIASVTPETGGALNIRLPETGVYWVYADPQFGAAAAGRVTLSTGTTSGLVLDGASAAFNADQPGQSAHYAIPAAAGQHMGFALSDLAVSDGTHVRIYAYSPTGTGIGDDSYCYVQNGGCDIDLYNPVAGTYSVVVQPAATGQRMQFTATLSSSVPVALVSDAPAMLQLARRGQDGMLSFQGAQGETLALQVAGQAAGPAGNTVRYRIYKPSDRRAGYYYGSMNPLTGGSLNMSLPETGTYWIWVDPDNGATASAQVTLATGTSGGLAANGEAVPVETILPGQTAYFRFTATAGQHMGFGLSDLVVSSGSQVRIYAYSPTGASIGDDSYCYVADGGCDIDIYNPVSGTYSVMVVPDNAEQAMQFNATLSSSVGLSLVPDEPVVMNLARRGQDGLLSFSGNQGENVSLQVAGQTSVPSDVQVSYRIYKPGDRRAGYYAYSMSAQTGGLINMVLPETGTYWVWANPANGATARAHVTLSTGTASGLQRDGALVPFASTHAGQPAHYRINAAAGENIGFALSGLAVSSGNHVRIYAYSPTGTSIGDDSYCYVADGGCDIDIFNAVAGTYSVTVVASAPEQTMQFNAGLSTSFATALARDVPLDLQLGRRGQDAMLTFTGSEGDTVALLLAGQSTLPAGNTVRYRIYRPGERRRDYAIDTLTQTVGGGINLVLPESGTYWVWVDPEHGATVDARVTVSTGAATPLVMDGTPSQLATSTPGEPVHFRVPATAGGQMGLAISGLSVSTGNHVRVYAYSPTGGGILSDTYCYVSDGGCDVDFYNTVAGDYSVLVLPAVAGQTMQFTATLSSSVMLTLQRGVPAPLSLARRGQDGLLSFAGTQGQKVTVQITGQSMQPSGGRVVHRVYKPSDRRPTYAVATANTTSASTLTLTLAETGTYWIHADPDHGRSASSTVTVSDAP